MTTSIDGRLSQARRLYHHMVHGGTIKRRDVACLVEALEIAQEEIEKLNKDKTGLALELMTTQDQVAALYDRFC